MANVPLTSSQRPVWLDDKTKSIMDREIAREQSLSRLLMTYIVAGLIFMLLPGTFLGVWKPTLAQYDSFSLSAIQGLRPEFSGLCSLVAYPPITEALACCIPF
jgi:hypothetical protein